MYTWPSLVVAPPLAWQRQMYNSGDHELTIKEDFHHGTCYLFSFSYHKITLSEKKYVIKLITLISMYHLKPLVSLQAHLKLKCKCTNCFLYRHFTDPFHNYFSY